MKYETRTEVVLALRDKEKEVEELKALLAATPELSEEEELAVALHKALCHWNHTDGCGWYYEFTQGQHQWNGGAHKEYLAKARRVIEKTPGMSNTERVALAQALR